MTPAMESAIYGLFDSCKNMDETALICVSFAVWATLEGVEL